MAASKKTDMKIPDKDDFSAKQLNLFQTFITNKPNQHSNLIELWDAVPKYHVTRRQQNKLRNDDGYLPVYKYFFKHRSESYDIEIFPARIETEDGYVEYYPGTREELVEDALRKLATVKNKSYLKDNRCGVVFSLYQLRKELQDTGHTFSFYELQEALEVMSHSAITIKSELKSDKSISLRTAILPSLLSVTDKKEGESSLRNSKWYADFASLVTESIRTETFRQFNYQKMMNYRSQLERWIYKRLAHNYIQASHQNSYSILLSTVERDSGLLQNNQLRHRMRKFNDVLDCLVKNKVLYSYETTTSTEGRKIIDVHYDLIPHQQFITEVKAANKRTKNNKLQSKKLK